MIKYNGRLKDVEDDLFNKRRSKYNNQVVFSDTIYSFDIEVSNLYMIDGKWSIFDYDRSKDFYLNTDMLALPYLWQFGINDNVYYGRDFLQFTDVLKKISNEYIRKIIWVHNLSYEFEFLLNIIDRENWTVERMLSRDLHKPITFYIPELNIEFRCSFMLTNMSLKNASKEFTNINKLDTLDYDSKVRTPLTSLTDEELKYSEYDILCVYEIVKFFKERYKHIADIPYTSTGEVRRRVRSELDYYHVLKMQKLVPNAMTYMMLWSVFSGGYTHANILNVGKVCENGHQMDIASSYPNQMLNKLPSSQFFRCMKKEFDSDPDNWGYIALIDFRNVRCRYYTTYIQSCKCIFSDDIEKAKLERRSLTVDNGRVISGSHFQMWITNIDFDIIKKMYDIEEYAVIKCYKSYLKYLDIRMIKLILELYSNKTNLKGIEEKKAVYKRDKSNLNSLYGMAVTNPLKQSSTYDNILGWTREHLTQSFINKKLDEMRKSGSTLMYYGQGVWITALARKALFDCLIPDNEKLAHEFDRHVIYSDTDSIKYMGNYDFIFNDYNKKVRSNHIELCKCFPDDLKIEMFEPHDNKGVCHPIGFYEKEADFEEFKTLGAKKYVTREDGKLHLTLSGVKKSGVSALNDDINNFKNGFVFDYKHSGKLTHFICDEMQTTTVIDDEDNSWLTDLKHGIILTPTTYTLGSTDLYDSLIDVLDIAFAERKLKNEEN